ncbi:hypothetical protein DNK47_00795, partial [Mycoplasma wenyonii]
KGRRQCDIEIEGEKRFILEIHPSLSFKSDVKAGIASDDLYLKGRGYVGNESVNFEETILGRGHRSGGENRWQLKVFKSGTTRLGELSGGEGIDYGDDDIECGKDWFIVEKPTYEGEGDWEKAVSKVTFKLANCTDIAKGRKECEIKIAKEKFILKKKISFLSL